MTKKKNLNEDGPDTIGRFLKRLQSTQSKISDLIAVVQGDITELNLEDLKDDLKKMLTSSQHAEKIILEAIDRGNAPPESDNPDLWKAFRHDLRAAIGAISGYTELILEDLEERGEQNLPFFKILQNLREITQEQMPFIDKLRTEDTKGYITPHGGLYEDASEPLALPHQSIIGKILVVDDDEHKRNILFRRLKKNGHKVLLAENGYRAMEILEKETIDLILLDILMPGISGIDVLKKLKSTERFKDIPVLVISSLNDVESVVECIKIGAEDYLPMPFNPILLMARVHACLDKKNLRDRETENMSELDRMRRQLEAALESIEDGFAVFNLFDEMTMCNLKFQELYPATKEITHPDYSYREFLEANYKAGRYKKEQRRKSDQEETFEDWIELRMARHQFAKEPYMEQLEDGRWIEISENRTPDGGTVSIHKDVTASKEGQDQLKYLAHHDPLTGLANRSLFEKSLQMTYEESLNRQTNFAVMYLDLDGFKQVNDTLGHEFGDFLLTHVSEKLLQNVREEDVVARLGGDEFAIVFNGVNSLQDILMAADRILEAVGNQVVRDDKQAEFGVSIGIAVYPSDGTAVEEILSKADQAMYAAKKSGKGVYRLASDL